MELRSILMQCVIKGFECFVTRRSLGAQHGLPQISVEDAVSREDIRVAFICTENVSHEDTIR